MRVRVHISVVAKTKSPHLLWFCSCKPLEVFSLLPSPDRGVQRRPKVVVPTFRQGECAEHVESTGDEKNSFNVKWMVRLDAQATNTPNPQSVEWDAWGLWVDNMLI